MPSSGGKDVRVKTASFPAVAVELGKTKGLQSTYIAIAGVALVVVVALVFLLFKRKKTE
ncbi:hypothetical protein DRN85_05280 [Methanosarcinales archaeon]|nr:MAG: hypothetical protein DRN85_05280 [Methanosarcinales archaeon]